MALIPAQASITFLGGKEGDWEFKRLTGWSNPSPREETLALMGFPEGRVWEWGDYLGASLIVTPNGRYAITRLQANAPGMLSSGRRNTEAIINVIDLQTFAVLSAFDTFDPLLAGSVWRLEPNGVLVSMIGSLAGVY
jgi:hypothetical protein